MHALKSVQKAYRMTLDFQRIDDSEIHMHVAASVVIGTHTEQLL